MSEPLSVHEQVRNLLGRYCERVDAGDWTGVGELFAAGRLADEHGSPLAEGAEGVRAFYTRGTRLHDGSPRTRHLVTNTVIEVEGATAVARSAYLVVQAAPGLPLQPIITGRYTDTFGAGEDGRLRWLERRFTADLVGDLSQHLTYLLPG